MAIAEATTCTTLAALEMLDANSNSSRSRLPGTHLTAAKANEDRAAVAIELELGDVASLLKWHTGPFGVHLYDIVDWMHFVARLKQCGTFPIHTLVVLGVRHFQVFCLVILRFIF